jgi:hypothetical protein
MDCNKRRKICSFKYDEQCCHPLGIEEGCFQLAIPLEKQKLQLKELDNNFAMLNSESRKKVINC